jgi:deoxyribose-phosphate aldolase
MRANILDGMTTSKPPDVARRPGPEPTTERVERLVVDADALEQRAAELTRLRRLSPKEEVSELLDIVRLLDLTSLSEDDTEADIRRLCETAREPIGVGIVERLDLREAPAVAAVCIHDRFVPLARRFLDGSAVGIAAVTAGFPAPHADLARRVADVRAVRAAGADEVDVVITRALARAGDWSTLHAEVAALRDAAGDGCLKAILAAGDLGDLTTVLRAGLVACLAGADFIKTSTGRERVNATLEAGLAMARAIRAYADETGRAVGLKPAGGIREASIALSWLRLAREELGEHWCDARLLRIGASSLLTDVHRRLGEIGSRG